MAKWSFVRQVSIASNRLGNKIAVVIRNRGVVVVQGLLYC